MRAPNLSWESFDAADRAAPPRPGIRAAKIEEFPGALPAFTREDPPVPEPSEEERAEAERKAQEEALAAALARARGEGRAAGFEEGAAAAEASFIAERRLILSEIRERLADAEMERERRDAETAAALRALSRALVGALAPSLGRAGLAAEVADAVAAAHDALMHERAAGQVHVLAPPAQLAAIRAALDEAGLDAALEADETLDALSARILWGGGVDAIDLQACIDAAQRAVEAHFDHEEELRAHG